MDAIKRYWTSLDQAARRALKRALIVPFIIGAVLLAATLAIYYAVVVTPPSAADDHTSYFGMLQAVMAALVLTAIYTYFLVYKAHAAIKENLFAHPADGYPTRETWSRTDGFILAIALLGITSLPEIAFGVFTAMVIPMEFELSSLSGLLWPVIGLILGPYAAKRYIPLRQDAAGN